MYLTKTTTKQKYNAHDIYVRSVFEIRRNADCVDLKYNMSFLSGKIEIFQSKSVFQGKNDRMSSTTRAL